MIIGSKNKGDWSEFYVMLYLLGTRNLYTADESLQRLENVYFPVKRVLRNDEPNENVDFVLEDVDRVDIYLNESLVRTMTSSEFKEESDLLYADIVSGSGSFDIPRSETFLNNIHLKRLAAPSTDIADIKMELHDTYTGIDQVMGFSAKSYIGGAPTLLNASGATNFVYEVIGLTDTQMDEINAIEGRTKILDRIRTISNLGGSLTYIKPSNNTFAENLMMVDSNMEIIISEMLLYSYTSGVMDCKEIIEYLESNNPLQYPRDGAYVYKFKQFLCAKALGMEPSAQWSGEDDANGGFIVAKNDGEVLAYHLYNRDKFKKYLFENTKFERGSTSRHGYATIYKVEDKMYINLNLQIRFKQI